MLFREWLPVRFIDRRVGTMHGRGGHNPGIDQGLGTLFTFNQNHLICLDQPGLVVQRSGIGRGHLAFARIPGPELLSLARRVVAIDDSNELASGVQVVPLGGGRPEIVGGSRRFGLTNRCVVRPTEQIRGTGHDTGEVRLNVGTEVGCNQVKDVTAIARGAIGPQTGLLAIEHHLQAVAGAAHTIAHQKVAATLLSSREHGGKDRLHATQQGGTDFVTLCLPAMRGSIGRARDLVEVKHGAPPHPGDHSLARQRVIGFDDSFLGTPATLCP